MPVCVAKIAVAAATYWVDRPYDYLVPAELQDKAVPGVRVYVPFSRGNRRSEGVILALSDHSDYEKLKPITAVLDDAPVLSPEQIKLALFMRERFFCTVPDQCCTFKGFHILRFTLIEASVGTCRSRRHKDRVLSRVCFQGKYRVAHPFAVAPAA